MKRWQWIATAVLVSFFALLAWAGTALAQVSHPSHGDHTADVLSYILAEIAALVDSMLGFWVSDNALTDPMGESLASSITSIVQSITVFFAQFSLIL